MLTAGWLAIFADRASLPPATHSCVSLFIQNFKPSPPSNPSDLPPLKPTLNPFPTISPEKQQEEESRKRNRRATMVTGFRRTHSLQESRAAPEKSYHVRSTSLPCRSHPIISQLEDEIRSLKAWQSQPESGSPAWICAGLTRLELLHASLYDLLNLPQTQESLRRGNNAGWTERIMEDFLHFADAHGTFRSTILALKQHHSAAQIAIRRRNESRLTASVRSQKKTEKELVKLASSLRDVAKSPITPGFASGFVEAELVGIMREVTTVTVSASASAFLGIAAVSTSMAEASPSRVSWMVGPLRRLPSFKRRSVEEEEEECRRSSLLRLEELEECIGALESRSDRLFRRLVNTRVSLLNILTP